MTAWYIQVCEVHPDQQLHSGLCPECGDAHIHVGAPTVRVVPGTDLVAEVERLQDQLQRLKEAIQPVLAAYRSGPSHITEDQITKAWEEFDRA